MTVTDAESILRSTEYEIGRLMPTALDMIASIVDKPGTDLDTYRRLSEVAEVGSDLVLFAVLRAAAGLAAIAELTGAEVRALATVKPDAPDQTD